MAREHGWKSRQEEWGFDFSWNINDGPINWLKAGRATDLGHAEYAADGSDKRDSGTCPFTSPEEVWEFDPAREYGVPSHAELVRHYTELEAKNRAGSPGQLVTGGYYKSVVSGAIEAFGWDMLLLAASDEERFAEVLRRFGRYTAHYVSAWAETQIEVFLQHDDMVWTGGPFVRPEFYRGVIFPIYKELWSIVKKAGKKVLYCSDGTWDMFMDDVAACGADGFIFEPSNNFRDVVRRFGKTHCLVGSAVDCRTMTFGTWEDVKREMDETLALSKECRGHIWAVGNHIPSNVSDEMCDRYISYLKANWNR